MEILINLMSIWYAYVHMENIGTEFEQKGFVIFFLFKICTSTVFLHLRVPLTHRIIYLVRFCSSHRIYDRLKSVIIIGIFTLRWKRAWIT